MDPTMEWYPVYHAIAIIWLVVKIGLAALLFSVVCFGISALCLKGLSALFGERNVNKASAVLLTLLALFAVGDAMNNKKRR